MDATPQGSLLPATLLSTHCELRCGGLGFGPLFPKQEGVWEELVPEGVFSRSIIFFSIFFFFYLLFLLCWEISKF